MKKLIYLFTLLTVLLVGCTTESSQENEQNNSLNIPARYWGSYKGKYNHLNAQISEHKAVLETNQGTKTRTEGQIVLDDKQIRFRANLPNNEILALFKNNNGNVTIVFSVGYDEIISEEYVPL